MWCLSVNLVKKDGLRFIRVIFPNRKIRQQCFLALVINSVIIFLSIRVIWQRFVWSQLRRSESSSFGYPTLNINFFPFELSVRVLSEVSLGNRKVPVLDIHFKCQAFSIRVIHQRFVRRLPRDLSISFLDISFSILIFGIRLSRFDLFNIKGQE